MKNLNEIIKDLNPTKLIELEEIISMNIFNLYSYNVGNEVYDALSRNLLEYFIRDMEARYNSDEELKVSSDPHYIILSGVSKCLISYVKENGISLPPFDIDDFDTNRGYLYKIIELIGKQQLNLILGLGIVETNREDIIDRYECITCVTCNTYYESIDIAIDLKNKNCLMSIIECLALHIVVNDDLPLYRANRTGFIALDVSTKTDYLRMRASMIRTELAYYMYTLKSDVPSSSINYSDPHNIHKNILEWAEIFVGRDEFSKLLCKAYNYYDSNILEYHVKNLYNSLREYSNIGFFSTIYSTTIMSPMFIDKVGISFIIDTFLLSVALNGGIGVYDSNNYIEVVIESMVPKMHIVHLRMMDILYKKDSSDISDINNLADLLMTSLELNFDDIGTIRKEFYNAIISCIGEDAIINIINISNTILDNNGVLLL